MKISKEKLTERLMERSGLERSQVERELQELVERIRNSAEKGKALEIREFGMFYHSREGELQFTPAEELKTEVNFRYAGMDPVEITTERQPSQASVGSPAGVDDRTDQNAQKPASTRAAEQPEPSESRTEKEPAAFDSKPKSGKSKDKLYSGSRRDKDPMSILVVAVTVIMVLVTGIIITMETGFLKDQPGESQNDSFSGAVEPEADESGSDNSEAIAGIGQNPNISAGQSPETFGINPIKNSAGQPPAVLGDPPMNSSVETAAGADFSEGSEGTEKAGPEKIQPNVVSDESAEVVESVENVEPESPYGLYGSVHNMEGRLYAVILHSVQGKQRAERIREELSEEGYRVMIRPVESGELGVMWRVGLGQFPTVPDAQQAVSELPQKYQDNHFIGLIQQD